MTFLTPTAATARVPAILAGLALVLAGALSLLSINIMGRSISFYLLPLLVVALWPRGVSGVATILGLFIGGLWVDWVSNGALGQWATIFLILFVMSRPDMKPRKLEISAGVFWWMATVVFGCTLLVLSGRLVFGVWPDWSGLGWQILLASILFLPVWCVRSLFGKFLRDPDDWEM